MIFTAQHPGSWQEFMMKPENKALPIQEATRKYNSQMLMFENQYSTFLQQQHQLQSQNSSGGGPRQAPPRPLILEYTIVSPNTTISIPLGGANFTEYNFSVDWGDGEVVEGLVGNNSNLNAQMVHTYAEPGVYEVTILGTFPYLYLYGGTNKNLLTDIKQWGTTKWESFAESFRGCTGLTNITSTDAPDLTRLKTQPLDYSVEVVERQGPKADLWYTFRDCSNLTNINFMSNWDMSQLRIITSTFRSCSNLTEFSAISNWNISNAISIYAVFQSTQCNSEDLQYMSNWNTSNIRYLGNFFAQLNSIVDIDAIANWDVSSVTNMNYMFAASSISDISGLTNWNVSNVTDMSQMFRETYSLNDFSPIENWDVSKVTDTSIMFYRGAAVFADFSNWKLDSLQNAEYMFRERSTYAIQGLSEWTLPNVTNLREFFRSSSGYIGSLANWNVSQVTNWSSFGLYAYEGAVKYIENYDDTLIAWAQQIPFAVNTTINMGDSIFTLGGEAEAARTALLQDGITIQDGGGLAEDFVIVVKTDNEGTSDDNQFTLPLVSGSTINATIDWGDGVINTVTSFDDTNATHTYSTAGTYTITMSGTVNGWAFNNEGDKLKLLDIPNWRGLEVSVPGGFYGCANLTMSNPRGYDGSTVYPKTITTTSLENYFRDCTNFNTGLRYWNVTTVTNIDGMFQNATSFNQPLWDWEPDRGQTTSTTANITSMNSTFEGATSFNNGITWDTSGVTSMNSTFKNATAFTRADIYNWDISNVTDMTSILDGVEMSITFYEGLLNNWATQVVQSNVTAGFGDAKYLLNSEANTNKAILTDTYNWVITDGGVINDTITSGFLFDNPDATTAYSLRQLATYETGFEPNVVKVRRDLDDVEQDFTAAQITDGTLETFCSGSTDGFVSVWYDQVNAFYNINDANQTTVNSQPKIFSSGSLIISDSTPSLEVDNANLKTRYFFTPNINEGYTTFNVFEHIGQNGNDFDVDFIISIGNGNSSQRRDMQLTTRGIVDTPIEYGFSTQASTSTILTPFSTGLKLATTLSDNYNQQLYLNSNIVGANEIKLNEPMSTPHRIVFGDSEFGTGNVCNIYFKECVVFGTNKLLDRTNIESNINNHYNIF